MDPQLHLKLHNARVEESLRGRHQSLAQRPRPPGQSRRQLAEVLRRLADRLEAPAGQPRHA
jgi:hypothetical protein